MLNKAFQAARSASKIAVVEVPGEQAGWIALQAGIAVRADAVLMPEIPCDLKNLASRLNDKISARRPYGLVVVAEGAKFAGKINKPENQSAGKFPEKIAGRSGCWHSFIQAANINQSRNLSPCYWQLGKRR